MIKKYIQLVILFVGFLVLSSSYAQTPNTNSLAPSSIQGLNLYPNPVSNGKLYISTSKNLSKDIEIFDVLGKKVFSSKLFSNTLDISTLKSGVYVIKIVEDQKIETRKLVIR